MSPRMAKRLFYGALFIAFWIVIAVLVYLGSFREVPTCFDGKQNQNEEKVDCGGLCESCILKDLKPLIITPVELVPAGADHASAILRFTNPNIFHGAASFSYEATFFNNRRESIYVAKGDSFIYPAQNNKAIVIANLPFDPRTVFGDPGVIVGDIKWRPAENFFQPTLSLRQRFTEFESGSDEATVSGIIVNNEAFALGRVEVGIVLYNGRRFTVGASRTVAFDIPAFGERFFKVAIPIVPGEDVDYNFTEIILDAAR